MEIFHEGSPRSFFGRFGKTAYPALEKKTGIVSDGVCMYGVYAPSRFVFGRIIRHVRGYGGHHIIRTIHTYYISQCIMIHTFYVFFFCRHTARFDPQPPTRCRTDVYIMYTYICVLTTSDTYPSDEYIYQL